MLTATTNFYIKFTFYQAANVKKIGDSGKKSDAQKNSKMKAEIAMLSRHVAPVAQWTSVLDF